MLLIAPQSKCNSSCFVFFFWCVMLSRERFTVDTWWLLSFMCRAGKNTLEWNHFQQRCPPQPLLCRHQCEALMPAVLLTGSLSLSLSSPWAWHNVSMVTGETNTSVEQCSWDCGVQCLNCTQVHLHQKADVRSQIPEAKLGRPCDLCCPSSRNRLWHVDPTMVHCFGHSGLLSRTRGTKQRESCYCLSLWIVKRQQPSSKFEYTIMWPKVCGQPRETKQIKAILLMGTVM